MPINVPHSNVQTLRKTTRGTLMLNDCEGLAFRRSNAPQRSAQNARYSDLLRNNVRNVPPLKGWAIAAGRCPPRRNARPRNLFSRRPARWCMDCEYARRVSKLAGDRWAGRPARLALRGRNKSHSRRPMDSNRSILRSIRADMGRCDIAWDAEGQSRIQPNTASIDFVADSDEDAA